MLSAHFTANKTISLCLNCPENPNMSLDFWPDIILFIILYIKSVTYWVLVIELPCFTNVKYGHITNMLFTNFSSAQTFGFAMSSLFLSRWCHCGFPKSSGFHFFEVCTTKPLFLLMTIVKESCSIMADSATPKTVVCQASLYMEFSGQEYWSGLLFPSLGDRPDTGIKPRSPALQAVSILSVWYYSPCLDFILFCFLGTLLFLSFLLFTFYYLYFTNIWTCLKSPSWRKSTFLNFTFPSSY